MSIVYCLNTNLHVIFIIENDCLNMHCFKYFNFQESYIEILKENYIVEIRNIYFLLSPQNYVEFKEFNYFLVKFL